jgi:hypothetical protein
MKYLKRYNESANNPETILKQMLKDSVGYTDDDILYYFSEFTDEYEWEYVNTLNLDSHRGYSWSVQDILRDGGPHIKITFKKEYPENLSLIERTIQFGKELEKFNNCYQQFKEFEENIKDLSESIHINGASGRSKRMAEISIDFIKLVPDILEEFKKKFNKNELKSKKITNQEIDYIKSIIDVDQVLDQINITAPDIDIEVVFEFDEVSIDSRGERIATFIPLIYINGEYDNNLSSEVSNILYNMDEEEFVYI